MKKFLLATIFISLSACTVHQTYCNEIKNKPAHQLRVTTFNLYWKNGTCHGNAPNSDVLALKKINSDVIFLQEISHISERCLMRHLHKLYPYHEFRYYGKEGGLAILSKYPYKTLHYVTPEYSRFPAWITELKTPYGPLHAVNVHLQPQVNHNDEVGMFAFHMFSSAKVRKAEIKRILNYLDPKYNNIIVGDFNESDYGGAVRILRKMGFCDALLASNKRQHTWHHVMGPIKTAQRFDRIFHYGKMNLTNVQIIHEGHSDHFPVLVDLSFGVNPRN